MSGVISVGVRTEITPHPHPVHAVHSLTWPCMNLNKRIKYLCNGYPHWALICLLCMRTATPIYVCVCVCALRCSGRRAITLKDRCAMKAAGWGMLIDHRDVCDCLRPDLLRFLSVCLSRAAQCISVWLAYSCSCKNRRRNYFSTFI